MFSHGRGSPDYIAKVRRKLDLDQGQAAELFGGSVNAFSRYENGNTKPPQALVKLLKLLAVLEFPVFLNAHFDDFLAMIDA